MSSVETVVEALRKEILDGERPGGQRLVEQELTARYGVARHTLRAALRELASEGLVRIEPNRGARVTRLSAEEIVELYELRTALEVEAARLALERHRGRLPAPVHEALGTLEAACRQRALALTRTGRSGGPGGANATGEAVVGVACTAALASDRPKRGEHRAHVALVRS